MHKSHQVKNIKRKAYGGVNGAKRKQFCKEYRRALPQIFSNMHNEYRKYIGEQKQISCKKQCAYCCYQHVSIPLAHGIIIVDYIYSHDEILNNFLSVYTQWEESAGNICREIDAQSNSAMQSHDLLALLYRANDPLISLYYDKQIPCPFLINSVCSIYEVRPINCAGHYSTSPCEWCSKSSKESPDVSESYPSEKDLEILFTLKNVSHNLFLRQETVPIMVHDILTEGLPFCFK